MPRKTLISAASSRPGCRSFNEAAARCRGKQQPRELRPGRKPASMRPRPDAAENMRRRTDDALPVVGFNEAAARCRGKQDDPGARFVEYLALQ